jgi:methylenetetrahydrofolate reductase (NADPH)
MSIETREDVALDGLRRRLENACYEIIPLRGVAEKARCLPAGTEIAITCSPEKGMPATLDLTRRLSGQGFTLIPHIAARMVTDASHLREILRELDVLGVRRAFVVGGDAERPNGIFESSLEILEVMTQLDHGIETVGIGAYPEGHPLVDEATLLSFLGQKQSFAAYMVTQMCFDPAVIVRWLRSVRAEGIGLPVHIGVPGAGERRKLLNIALKIGVGQSVRFLRSNLGLVGRMIKPGSYSPDELLLALAPHFDAPPCDIKGIHIYSFNQIEDTERWRAEMLDRLDGGKDSSL